MIDAKLVITLLPTSLPLMLHSSSALTNPTAYQALGGSLSYLSLIWLDIAFVMNKLSQFMHCPTTNHQATMKHLLDYLPNTSDHGLLLFYNSMLLLHAFSGADLACNKDDFTSIGAYIIYLGCNAISWSSKKQYTIAHSSTEAKYRLIIAIVIKLNWVCFLL